MSTIVIIDDRVTNREILARLAASLEAGVRVKAFAEPRAALEWVRRHVPDLVITDFRMPGMDGAAFTRELRQREACRDVPVVVVTAYEDREYRYEALDSGATDFLMSPVDHREFLFRSRNLLALGKHQRAARRRAAFLQRRLEARSRLHEAALRESQDKLRLVIDTVPAMISATDAEGRYAFVNNRLASMLGIEPKDAEGRTASELLGERYGARSLALDRQVFESGEMLPGFEEEIAGSDGGTRTLLTTKAPLKNLDGRVCNVVTVSLDITERKEAKDELARQKNFLRAVVDADPAFIFTTDREGRLTLANRAFTHACGVAAEAIIGRRHEEVSPEARQAAMFAADARQVLAAGKPLFIAERPFVCADGRKLVVQAVSVPIRARGDAAEVLTVCADITLHKEAEAALRDAKEAAEMSDRAKTDFLANMSHELRTPLNVIIGFTEMMNGELLGPIGAPRYREYVTDILGSARHLLTIIDDILDVSKVEAGKLDLREEEIEVAAVVESAVRLVKGRSENCGVAVETAITGPLPRLRADATRVKQILVNLLSNAVKFSSRGSTVRVSAGRDVAGGVEISVADQGIGMTPEEIRIAASRFGQIDSSMTRKYPGTGLGLPLAIALTELHQGRLEIESTKGVGTTVTVRFPPARIVPAEAARVAR